MDAEEHQSTTLFREYLRIRSVQPDPDYGGIEKFLAKYAETNGFLCKVVETGPNRAVITMTIEGINPSLPSILLNSHTDVVPVFPESWKYEPFSATKEDNGDIYARGSQDMKCVGIQYLEALRELSSQGVKLLRTVHLSFVPDEETGGPFGMAAWVDTEDFKSRNIGFAMDEGIANPGEEMKVFYAERVGRWGSFIAKGNPGHGSAFLEGTAGPKAHKVMGKILDFRNQEETRLKSDPALTLGDVTTINITSLKGGVQSNVVPAELEVGFDLRATPSALDEVDKMMEDWCSECDVTIKWLLEPVKMGLVATDLNDKWCTAFHRALDSCDVKYSTEVFSASTDSWHLRNLGVPALGFSPMNRTPILLHDHNEFLNETVFLRGVQIMKTIIQDVANVQD